uniref:Uncharacterized protein n=1 Tax=Candidatus Kentrum sp. LPFa TaxID=2126335 RepID=A0A450VX38_9GAMM|nr:MAG: hypothetical protein BECKLPF1236B_GA0070989_100821 [Candidatus Kentron sp. LPFa]
MTVPDFFDRFVEDFPDNGLTLMKRVPITLENETTTPVGRVVGATGRSPLLRVTRQKCIIRSEAKPRWPNALNG